MKQLSDEFILEGYSHKQIIREGRFAIFSRTDSEGKVTFEVIIIQKMPQGYKKPAHEYYPSGANNRKALWSFQNLPDAERKYKSLMGKENILNKFEEGQSS